MVYYYAMKHRYGNDLALSATGILHFKLSISCTRVSLDIQSKRSAKFRVKSQSKKSRNPKEHNDQEEKEDTFTLHPPSKQQGRQRSVVDLNPQLKQLCPKGKFQYHKDSFILTIFNNIFLSYFNVNKLLVRPEISKAKILFFIS